MSRTAQIDVSEVSSGLYDVVVDSFTSAKSLRVTLNDETHNRLGKGRTKEEFISDAIRFLLEREPKEQILSEFDIEDIKKYYSEFESAITK